VPLACAVEALIDVGDSGVAAEGSVGVRGAVPVAGPIPNIVRISPPAVLANVVAAEGAGEDPSEVTGNAPGRGPMPNIVGISAGGAFVKLLRTTTNCVRLLGPPPSRRTSRCSSPRISRPALARQPPHKARAASHFQKACRRGAAAVALSAANVTSLPGVPAVFRRGGREARRFPREAGIK
jgi:hypothetical protein